MYKWDSDGPRKKSRQQRSLPSPERLRAGRSPLFRAHVGPVRSARKNGGCGLAGRHF